MDPNSIVSALPRCTATAISHPAADTQCCCSATSRHSTAPLLADSLYQYDRLARHTTLGVDTTLNSSAQSRAATAALGFVRDVALFESHAFVLDYRQTMEDSGVVRFEEGLTRLSLNSSKQRLLPLRFRVP